MRALLGLWAALILAAPVFAAGKPMTVDDLLAVKGVSDPQVSPDGFFVAYVVTEIDRAANKGRSDVWLVPVAGGVPRRLTSSPGNDNHPRWSPDGGTIAFVSDRGGSSQVWLLPVAGGEATQLTKLPIDVAGPIWSPKGDKIAFAAEVFPGKTVEETAAKDKEKADSKSKVRVFDSLMIRHWTAWDEGKRSHLFVCDAKTGEAKDLTPNLDVNTPPAPFGGSDDYAWSPDGLKLAFTAEPAKEGAWSTNSDIWEVGADGGDLKNLTASNTGADAQPAYSPDGKWLSCVRQARAGFEADQWVLTLIDRKTGASKPLTPDLDRPVLSYAWSGKAGELGATIWAVIDHEGTEPIIRLRVSEDGTFLLPAALKDILYVTGGVNAPVCPIHDPTVRVETLVHVRHSANSPAELYRSEVGKAKDGPGVIKSTRLTQHNVDLAKSLDLATAEGFSFQGADGDPVSGWLIKPPGFDPTKKYPVLFLIHGGPQGAWHDEWHARWNYSLFASPGYAVVAINPRGSTGYGQKFTDQISLDWTGRVYDDLMKGLDHALKTYPFLDEKRMAAAGGSYGGFMVNWILGHSNRFKCLISHAGVFDLTSKYGTTEELWFPEWEFGGPPWKDSATAQRYLDQSPSRFAEQFQTPTLVTHGALDFRVPDAQGIGLFTALQRKGVPSRLVFFPDEGHWILKPANRVVWWNEMHNWLAKYLKSGR